MGGGGFTAGPDDPALDDLALRLTGLPRPRLCLLPTAGGDSEHQIRRFYETYGDRLCEPSHISLFRLGRKPVPLREHLLAQDAIYVGGGSMVNLLAIWRAQGLDTILREAWESGVVLAGLRAGCMCWFEWGVTTSSGAPAPAPGLGFLTGSNSVHHDSEPSRRPVYLEAVRRAEIPPGWAVDDGAALIFRGGQLTDVVATRAGARAYEVTPSGERPLEARLLASPAEARATMPAVAEMRRLRLARSRLHD
jgi:dipeptidase E